MSRSGFVWASRNVTLATTDGPVVCINDPDAVVIERYMTGNVMTIKWMRIPSEKEEEPCERKQES